MDGQNLFHAARRAFGYAVPNYDVVSLARAACHTRGWTLVQIRFYTGVPDQADDQFRSPAVVSRQPAPGRRPRSGRRAPPTRTLEGRRPGAPAPPQRLRTRHPVAACHAAPVCDANALHRPGYVSLQSALAHYGMIPESVPVTTSVTSGRPMALADPSGYGLASSKPRRLTLRAVAWGSLAPRLRIIQDPISRLN